MEMIGDTVKDNSPTRKGVMNFTTQMLKCQFCGTNVPGLYNMNKHLSKVHKAKINITCNLCGKIFHKSKEFKKHLQKHRRSGLEDFIESSEEKKSRKEKHKKHKKKKNSDHGKGVIADAFGNKETLDKSSKNVLSDQVASNKAPSEGLGGSCATDEEQENDGWWGSDGEYLPASPVIETSMDIRGNLLAQTEQEDSSKLVPELHKSVPTNDLLQKTSRKSSTTGTSMNSENESNVTGTNEIKVAPRDSYSCNVCDLVFKNRQFLIIHSNYHTVKIEASCRCSLCCRNYRSPWDYIRHINLFHRKRQKFLKLRGMRVFECKKCPYRAWTAESLRAHSRVHRGIKYPCIVCGQILSTPQSVRRHMRIFHSSKGNDDEAEKVWPCDICDKVLSDPGSIRTHMEVYHENPDFIQPDSSTCNGSSDSLLNDSNIENEGRRILLRSPEKKSPLTTSMAGSDKTLSKKLDSKKCGLCQKVCRSYSSLLDHMAVHTTERNHGCDMCDKRFKNFSSLRRHIKIYHDIMNSNNPSEQRPYKCSQCPKSFHNISSFQRHQDIHRYPEAKVESPCRVCNVSVAPGTISSHMKLHAESNQNILCPHCGKQYRQISSYKRHLLTHIKEPTETTCLKCGREFETKELLEVHSLMHPDSPICEVCGKRLRNVYSLRIHMERHQERRYKCDECGKMCKTVGDLKFHSYTHLKTKPFQCKFCDYTTRHPSNVKLHIFAVHIGPHGFRANEEEKKEKTFICGVCGEGYPNTACLDFHLQYHQDKSIVCKKCNEIFHTKYDLQYHNKQTHAVVHTCADCNKVLPSKGLLEQHRRYAHTNETPFPCTMCDKRYKSRGDLSYHMATHTGDYKHVCEICGKKTISKGNMTAHMRTHFGFKCQKCDFSCGSQSQLRKHQCESENQKTVEEVIVYIQDCSKDDQQSVMEETTISLEPSQEEGDTGFKTCIFCKQTISTADFAIHLRDHAATANFLHFRSSESAPAPENGLVNISSNTLSNPEESDPLGYNWGL